MIKDFLINFGVMFGSILVVFLLVAGGAALYNFVLQTFSTAVVSLVTLVFAMAIASGVVAFIMTLTEYEDDL